MTAAVYLARHGETDFNKVGRLQGKTDTPLNETGRAQASALAERVRRLGIVEVGASTLQRARETREICARALGVPSDYEDADLRERSYGVFEGLTRDELRAQHGAAFSAWQKDNRFAPEGGEAFEAVSARMLASVARGVQRARLRGGGLLLVTHGGAIRALIYGATGQFVPPPANGAVFRVAMSGGSVTDLLRLEEPPVEKVKG